MKIPEKLTEKARSIAEYRPTRKDIATIVGVAAFTALGMTIEEIYGPDRDDTPIESPSSVSPETTLTTTTTTSLP